MGIGFYVAVVVAASCWYLSARYTAVHVARAERAQRAAALLAAGGSFGHRVTHTDGHGNIVPGPDGDDDSDSDCSTVHRVPGRHAVHRDHEWFGPGAFTARRRAGRPDAEAVA